MYLVYNIGHIHPFFNVPKQSNLLISVSGGSIPQGMGTKSTQSYIIASSQKRVKNYSREQCILIKTFP
jgi:hypothetical protein